MLVRFTCWIMLIGELFEARLLWGREQGIPSQGQSRIRSACCVDTIHSILPPNTHSG